MWRDPLTLIRIRTLTLPPPQVPRGVGCVTAVAHLRACHREMMEEARAIQRGEPYPPKPKPAAGPDAADPDASDGRDAASAEGDGTAPLPPSEPSPPQDPPPLSVLRRHLWRFCPKLPLGAGMLCSLVLTTASFAAPWVQGRLFDAAVNAAHASAHHRSNRSVDEV